jgi:hypothetical protein
MEKPSERFKIEVGNVLLGSISGKSALEAACAVAQRESLNYVGIPVRVVNSETGEEAYVVETQRPRTSDVGLIIEAIVDYLGAVRGEPRNACEAWIAQDVEPLYRLGVRNFLVGWGLSGREIIVERPGWARCHNASWAGIHFEREDVELRIAMNDKRAAPTIAVSKKVEMPPPPAAEQTVAVDPVKELEEVLSVVTQEGDKPATEADKKGVPRWSEVNLVLDGAKNDAAIRAIAREEARKALAGGRLEPGEPIKVTDVQEVDWGAGGTKRITVKPAAQTSMPLTVMVRSIRPEDIDDALADDRNILQTTPAVLKQIIEHVVRGMSKVEVEIKQEGRMSQEDIDKWSAAAQKVIPGAMKVEGDVRPWVKLGDKQVTTEEAAASPPPPAEALARAGWMGGLLRKLGAPAPDTHVDAEEPAPWEDRIEQAERALTSRSDVWRQIEREPGGYDHPVPEILARHDRSRHWYKLPPLTVEDQIHIVSSYQIRRDNRVRAQKKRAEDAASAAARAGLKTETT